MRGVKEVFLDQNPRLSLRNYVNLINKLLQMVALIGMDHSLAVIYVYLYNGEVYDRTGSRYVSRN